MSQPSSRRRSWSLALLLALGGAGVSAGCSRDEAGSRAEAAARGPSGERAAAVNAAAPARRAPPPAAPPRDEDGYELWLRYPRVSDGARLAEYRAASAALVVLARSPTLDAARSELERGVDGLLGVTPAAAASVERDGSLVLGTLAASPEL